MSIELLQTYHHVFLMDCTYKTNMFNMSLFNIVGLTSTNSTFFGAFAFLQTETEEDYKWALMKLLTVLGGVPSPKAIVTDRELALLNAIPLVFPQAKNILCLWHVNKNVRTRCKKHFPKDEWEPFKISWNAVTNARTEPEYDEKWSVLTASLESRLFSNT